MAERHGAATIDKICAAAYRIPTDRPEAGGTFCGISRLRHIEWFHDHARIEQMLFDGAPVVRDGNIAPDLTRFGHALSLKAEDTAPFHAFGEALT
jgi:hypothetical protein